MKTRQAFIILLLYLFFFFNMTRLFNLDTETGIGTFTYVLGVIYVILPLALPRLFLYSAPLTILIGLVTYLFCKLFIFNSLPLAGGIYTFISITETSLLAILIWLSLRLSAKLNNTETIIESLTLSEVGKRIKPIEEVLHMAENEMSRCRRYEHPLSVIVVEPEDQKPEIDLAMIAKSLEKTIASNVVFTNISNVLSDVIRQPDLVMKDNSNKRFIICCPETTNAHSREVTERIRAAVEQSKLSVVCGVATFPDEALTLEELVKRAESGIKRQSSDVQYEQPSTDSKGETVKAKHLSGTERGIN